jgi:hypothetical protein
MTKDDHSWKSTHLQEDINAELHKFQMNISEATVYVYEYYSTVLYYITQQDASN